MVLGKVSVHRSYGGTQGYYRHHSRETNSDMLLSVFVPQRFDETIRFPVVWYLSGFASSPTSITERGDYRRACGKLGLIFVALDTRPRGADIPADPNCTDRESIDAGCYLDATRSPFAKHYRMFSYIVNELPALIDHYFPADINRQSILGHSVGGHAALMIALSNRTKFTSASAFSPLASLSRIPWGARVMREFLGSPCDVWRRYDVIDLLHDGYHFPEFLIDTADEDPFANSSAPDQLIESCLNAGVALTYNSHPGYDQSNYFVSTFMEKHLEWHAKRLGAAPSTK